MLTGVWAPGPGTVPQRATLPNSMHIRTLGVRAGGAIHSSSRQCDKHLEMVVPATKIADHVELPISQLNIS